MSAPTEVLLVEDNPGDAVLAQRILRAAGSDVTVHHVSDAAEALAALKGTPRYGLVLLDLNLPGMHGTNVLRSLRADPAIAYLPVVVLSSSERPGDILDAYACGANAYVTKPHQLEEYRQVLLATVAFWLETATSPGRSGEPPAV